MRVLAYGARTEPYSLELRVLLQKERQFQSDNNIRRTMIASTFGQGLLMGYTINQRYLSSQPIAFITPIAVSFGYAQVSQRAKGDRAMILCASLGSAVSAHLVIGALTGQLGAAYEFLALGYVALSGIIMQLLFHTAQWGPTVPKLAYLAWVLA
ncbi:hypothetical protein TELCIR_13075 [Teladorsagia circumcincta]|uniref:Uncharacterized protein n=1 Tax=Teladorsagia circumcincta TaxID=45464 RepID=A0A2G9U504_TELCI|nr:hypothetical protein TELCIR_13075 [Teladorsagia circumcincta]